MPKLTYFDFAGGRGEDCRLALHIAGVDFEDDRIARGEWMARKPTTPFGNLPLYEEDGRVLAQSNAILQYLGRKHGLHPSDPFEAALHESVLSAVEELRGKIPFARGLEEDDKKRVRTEFAEGTLQKWASGIESLIQGPFLSGDQLNVADLKLFISVSAYLNRTMDYIGPEYLDPFPKLLGLVQAVSDDPRVRSWYAKG